MAKHIPVAEQLHHLSLLIQAFQALLDYRKKNPGTPWLTDYQQHELRTRYRHMVGPSEDELWAEKIRPYLEELDADHLDRMWPYILSNTTWSKAQIKNSVWAVSDLQGLIHELKLVHQRIESAGTQDPACVTLTCGRGPHEFNNSKTIELLRLASDSPGRRFAIKKTTFEELKRRLVKKLADDGRRIAKSLEYSKGTMRMKPESSVRLTFVGFEPTK